MPIVIVAQLIGEYLSKLWENRRRRRRYVQLGEDGDQYLRALHDSKEIEFTDELHINSN